MGEVIYYDFLAGSWDQRQEELDEAIALAQTSPDLVLAAPALRDFLIIVRNDVLKKYNEVYPAVESLLEWLHNRDPVGNPTDPPPTTA